MKKIIQSILHQLGYVLVNKSVYQHQLKQAKPKKVTTIPSMVALGEKLKSIGLNPKTIVDIGAAEGSWSLQMQQVWPNSHYLLFEPLEERKEQLTKLAAEQPNFSFVPFAAGKNEETIYFKVTNDLDGSGITTEQDSEDVRSLTVKSIEAELQRLQLQGNYGIKLDTHGYEIPIIEGCEAIMPQVDFFIIECYGFYLTPNSLLFHELCAYMFNKGYRLFDVIDIMHRKIDNAFWQCDAVFIKHNHTVFSNNSYQ